MKRIPGLDLVEVIDKDNDAVVIHHNASNSPKRAILAAIAGGEYNYTETATTVTNANQVNNATTVTNADNVQNADTVTNATNVFNIDWTTAETTFLVVDDSESDQGVTGGGNTIYALAAGVGATKIGVIICRHTGVGNTTEYELDTDIDWSTKSNLYLYMEPGAVLTRTTGDETFTLFHASRLVTLSAIQKVTAVNILVFENGGIVRPETWGAMADGSTNDVNPINWAIESIYQAGGVIEFQASRTYRTNSYVHAMGNVTLEGSGCTIYNLAITAGNSFPDNICIIAYPHSYESCQGLYNDDGCYATTGYSFATGGMAKYDTTLTSVAGGSYSAGDHVLITWGVDPNDSNEEYARDINKVRSYSAGTMELEYSLASDFAETDNPKVTLMNYPFTGIIRNFTLKSEYGSASGIWIEHGLFARVENIKAFDIGEVAVGVDESRGVVVDGVKVERRVRNSGSNKDGSIFNGWGNTDCKFTNFSDLSNYYAKIPILFESQNRGIQVSNGTVICSNIAAACPISVTAQSENIQVSNCAFHNFTRPINVQSDSTVSLMNNRWLNMDGSGDYPFAGGDLPLMEYMNNYISLSTGEVFNFKGQMTEYRFYYDNMAQSLINQAMTNESNMTRAFGHGLLFAVFVQISGTLSAGTISLEVRKGGTIYYSKTLDSSADVNYFLDPSDFTFSLGEINTGDLLTVTISTSADLAPTTMDMRVSLLFAWSHE